MLDVEVSRLRVGAMRDGKLMLSTIVHVNAPGSQAEDI